MSDSIVNLYARRARTLYVQNEFDRALVDLREALRLAPDGDSNLTWILQTLGDCYFSKRNPSAF
jgi:tetratricopeptide (TPR) repeat protein